MKTMKDQLEDKIYENQSVSEELKEYKELILMCRQNDKDKMVQKIAENAQQNSILNTNLIKYFIPIFYKKKKKTTLELPDHTST